MQNCDSQYFFGEHDIEELCQVSQTQCSEQTIMINYYDIIYCQLNGNWGYFIIIFFIVVAIIFRLMSTLIEYYLTPSIEFISGKLKFSQSLSAATLLALANGAGDVITALVASETLDAMSYNIGALYGAGFFVSTLVIGITIINSKSFIVMKPYFVWRDLFFYIFSTFVIIMFGIIGEFSLFSSISLLLLYFVLIIIIIIQDKFQSKKIDFTEQLIQNDSELNITQDTENIEQQDELLLDKNENDKSCADQTFCCVDVPFKLLLKFCIPPAQDFSKLYCLISIIPSLSFLYFILGDSFDIYTYIYLISVSIPIIVYIYITYKNDELPQYYLFIQIFITINSLTWIYFLSSILIDTLQFFGMLTNLSNTYLGITVIAMGNALPDALVTITLAKQGYATMGITGAYFGQIFGLLVGLGISLIKSNLRTGEPVEFDLFNKELLSQNIIMIIIIFATYFVLIVTFGYGIIKKYKFGRDLSIFLIFIYIIVFIIVTTIAIYQAI